MGDVQVVIPMSGVGQRFKDAGYSVPKPFIEIAGRPLIHWVVSMFPGETDIVFICREDHLADPGFRQTLSGVSPTAKIRAIAPHKKGPVYALFQGRDAIADDKAIVVSYCDYFMTWDYAGFKQRVFENGADGAIPCYTGFHPHLVPRQNLYASCKVDAENRLLDIREKFSWEQDKEKALHSPGLYYFKSGARLKSWSEQMLARDDLALNGEYYVSLLYKILLAQDCYIDVPATVAHFCQFGTPEDLAECRFWMRLVKRWAR